MANIDVNFVESFRHELGERDGVLTFEEVCVQVQGLKLCGPQAKPLKSNRPVGDVCFIDLPVRDMDTRGGKLEQFADIVQNFPIHGNLKIDADFLDMTVYPLCAQAKYRELPEPFRLKAEPKVPYSMQIVIVPSYLPPDKEQEYVDIFKHIYLHRNKVSSADCVAFCHGVPVCFDWGKHSRVALAGLNNMLDRTGGMQIRLWTLAPKFEKKHTLDQSAREAGYRFIREHGPRSNNMNQFMEWTDEQVHCPGGPLEGWQEGKVKEALHNYYRGRQNAKTIQYWPLTLKSFVAWFLDEILVKMLPTMRQHAITWIGRTRVGKSLGSKTILFAQSKFEITQADREDLVPSIVTAKHLDFFKAEPITKFKPGVFDDGMLQRMDSSFLKAFLNPSATWLFLVTCLVVSVTWKITSLAWLEHLAVSRSFQIFASKLTYTFQTRFTFRSLRKKMPQFGLATRRRNSTRVLDVMLVTTPTTMFLIVSSSKDAEHRLLHYST